MNERIENKMDQVAVLEAVLFASGDPVSLERLSQVLDMEIEEVKKLAEVLENNLEKRASGIELRVMGDALSLATKPSMRDYLESFFQEKPRQLNLSQAAYETLAVVAYNEPVTRAQIESVRGVNSDGALNRLIEKGLVEMVGNLELPGRPSIFATTPLFLRLYGIRSLDELEPMDMLMYDTVQDFEKSYKQTEALAKEEEAEDQAFKEGKVLNKWTIAIDGPSGAGKSTIAKKVAEILDITYLDTGAMYRACGLACKRQDLTMEDKAAIEDLVQELNIDIRYEDGNQHVYLNGEDVSRAIREGDMGVWASNVSKLKQVRLRMVDLQRQMAENQSIIMDGRDIGTYVLPDAEYKIFLTADVEERARRRYEELLERDPSQADSLSFDQVMADMKFRDKQDAERDFAPLKKSDDAYELDTTGLTIDEVVQAVLDYVRGA